VRGFILRRRHPGAGEECAQGTHAVAIERVIVVRTVQHCFGTVEFHARAVAVERFGTRAQVMQQGLDLAPVDIGTDRILEDRPQQGTVVAHGQYYEPVPGCAQIAGMRENSGSPRLFDQSPDKCSA